MTLTIKNAYNFLKFSQHIINLPTINFIHLGARIPKGIMVQCCGIIIENLHQMYK